MRHRRQAQGNQAVDNLKPPEPVDIDVSGMLHIPQLILDLFAFSRYTAQRSMRARDPCLITHLYFSETMR